jgi:hypothetical protein
VKGRFLLVVSAALNVALAGVVLGLVKRPASVEAADSRPNPIARRAVPAPAGVVPAPEVPLVVRVEGTFDWSQVASTNLVQYAANLRALECPKQTLREVIVAVVNQNFARRRHAIYEPLHARFWELMVQPDDFKENGGNDIDERSKNLRTEREEALKAALGENWERDSEPPSSPVLAHEPVLSFLPLEKQRRWWELDDSFEQRRQSISQTTRGDPAAQKAQVAVLEKERDDARQQLLTPEEFQEYTLRNSPRADWAQNLAGFEASEEEYRTLNSLHAATPTNQMNQFNIQAQALLGEERFVSFQRGQDARFAELLAVAERCQLPTNTVELIYRQRVNAEQQCAVVRSNRALSADVRTALCAALQLDARQQVLTVLGQTMGEAYLRRHGNWVEALKR